MDGYTAILREIILYLGIEGIKIKGSIFVRESDHIFRNGESNNLIGNSKC